MPKNLPKKPREKTGRTIQAAKQAPPPIDAEEEPDDKRPKKMLRLAEKLDRLFGDMKDNQSQFGRKHGWTATQVSRWRNGPVQPDAVKLLTIARQFNIDVAYLIDDDMTGPPVPSLTEDERDILKTCRNLKLDNQSLQQRLWQMAEMEKKMAEMERQLNEGPKPLAPGRGDTGNRNHRSG